MYEEQENCTLTCNGEEVAMKSVHVHGKLDGLLLMSMPVVISPLWPVEFSPTPGSFGLSALL